MKTLLLLFVGGCYSLPTLRADTIEIIASADTTLHEGQPVVNYGALPDLRAGAVEGGLERRTLMRFNIGGAVPPGATITGAQLTIEALDEPGDPAAPDEFEIYRVRDFWNEGDGLGTDASTQEATWESRAHPKARWTQPGGARGIDFAQNPSAAVAVGASGAYAFGATPKLLANVQRWLDQPQSNHGWMLTRAAGSTSQGVRVFAAREAGAGAPRLTVEFTPAPASLAPSAQYDVVFHATWSAATHPRDFPAGAHWSGLVGGLHTPAAVFWGRGATASLGIKQMSEFGSQSALLSEVSAAISAGTANRTLAGGGLGAGAGTVSLRFTVDRTHPLVTLTSMIAPSPDWFVGVRGLPLIEKGEWVSSKSIDLFPYDAGTDSGVTFASADLVTDPRGVITRIISRPLAIHGRAEKMGTFTFTRVPAAP